MGADRRAVGSQAIALPRGRRGRPRLGGSATTSEAQRVKEGNEGGGDRSLIYLAYPRNVTAIFEFERFALLIVRSSVHTPCGRQEEVRRREENLAPSSWKVEARDSTARIASPVLPPRNQGGSRCVCVWGGVTT